MGLAIENLAKGIIMVIHPEYLKSNAELNKKKIRTHNVCGLLDNNDICGFEEDKELLNALSTRVIWMSRYPVPLERKNFSWETHWMNPESIDNLYKRLYDRLDELSKRGDRRQKI